MSSDEEDCFEREEIDNPFITKSSAKTEDRKGSKILIQRKTICKLKGFKKELFGTEMLRKSIPITKRSGPSRIMRI